MRWGPSNGERKIEIAGRGAGVTEDPRADEASHSPAHVARWTRGKGEMKRLAVTTYLMIALIGPSLAQDVASVGKKAKPKQSSECRPVGTVKGTKLWAGNCVAPEPMAAPVAEPESEPETTGAIRGSK